MPVHTCYTLAPLLRTQLTKDFSDHTGLWWSWGLLFFAHEKHSATSRRHTPIPLLFLKIICQKTTSHTIRRYEFFPVTISGLFWIFPAIRASWVLAGSSSPRPSRRSAPWWSATAGRPTPCRASTRVAWASRRPGKRGIPARSFCFFLLFLLGGVNLWFMMVYVGFTMFYL